MGRNAAVWRYPHRYEGKKRNMDCVQLCVCPKHCTLTRFEPIYKELHVSFYEYLNLCDKTAEKVGL